MVFHLEGRNPHLFTLECAKIYTTVLNENTKKSLLFQCFSVRIYQIVKFEIFKLTFFRMTFEFLWFSGQNFSAWRKFMWIIGQNNLKSNRGWNIPNVVDLMISSFLDLSINFDLWFSSTHVRNELDFAKIVWGVP